MAFSKVNPPLPKSSVVLFPETVHRLTDHAGQYLIAHQIGYSWISGVILRHTLRWTLRLVVAFCRNEGISRSRSISVRNGLSGADRVRLLTSLAVWLAGVGSSVAYVDEPTDVNRTAFRVSVASSPASLIVLYLIYTWLKLS